MELRRRKASQASRGGLLLSVWLWRGVHFHFSRRSRCGAVHTFFLDSRKPRATARLFFIDFNESSEAPHASSTFSVLLPEASRESSTFIAHLLGSDRSFARQLGSWSACVGSFARELDFFGGRAEASRGGDLREAPKRSSGCRARKIDFLEGRLI